VAAEYRFPYWAAVGRVFRGRDLLLDGAPGAAVSEISAGLAALQASGARLALVHDLALLARAHEVRGDRQHALASLDEAIGHADRSGERWYDAELHRMRADLLLRSGRGDEAAAGFARAIEVARGQNAALWELRGGLGLARLRRDQGRRAEARDALMPLYGRFTEGLDTPDLKEAEALLGELA
jgi:predicted ATPase